MPGRCREGLPTRQSLCQVASIVIVTALTLTLATTQVRAQSMTTAGSLGGYGATSISPMAGMGSSTTVIPYAGSFGGFMPYRTASGMGSGLSFLPRGGPVMGSSRTPFRLAPLSGEMEPGRGPGRGLTDRSGAKGVMGPSASPLMGRPMGTSDRPGVVPPSFGYPFYYPPSLLAPAGSAAGMSM